MSKFDEWYVSSFGSYFEDDGIEMYSNYGDMKQGWDYQQERINKVIERLEEYPCDTSSYVTIDQRMAADKMRYEIIDILKEELL